MITWKKNEFIPRFTCTSTSLFNPKVDRDYVIIFLGVKPWGKSSLLLIKPSSKRGLEGKSNRNLQEYCFPSLLLSIT
jgi:hypothetical protein